MSGTRELAERTVWQSGGAGHPEDTRTRWDRVPVR